MNKQLFSFFFGICLYFSSSAAMPWQAIESGNSYWAKTLGLPSHAPRQLSASTINNLYPEYSEASFRLINAALHYQISQLQSGELSRFADSLSYVIIYLSGGSPALPDNYDRAGWWKLSYPVAKRFGLVINENVDERFDFEKSTLAALAYSKYLQKHQGGKKWLYSFVEGPILANRDKNSNASDSLQFALQAVKKLIKATNYTSAETYAVNYYFSNVKPWRVNKPMQVDVISEKTGIPKNVFFALNPELRSKTVPAKTTIKLTSLALDSFKVNESDIALLSALRFEEGTTKIAAEQEKAIATSTPNRASQVYRVKSGDNLGVISERYGVSVRDLKNWNSLRSDVIFAGQKLVVYSKNEATPLTASAIQKEETPKSKAIEIKPGEFVSYKVKNGDTLWSIAQKFPGVSPNNLMDWNSVSTDIKVGQELKVLKSEISNYSAVTYPDSQ